MLRGVGGDARPWSVVTSTGDGVDWLVMLVAYATGYRQALSDHQRCGAVNIAVMRQTELHV